MLTRAPVKYFCAAFDQGASKQTAFFGHFYFYFTLLTHKKKKRSELKRLFENETKYQSVHQVV